MVEWKSAVVASQKWQPATKIKHCYYKLLAPAERLSFSAFTLSLSMSMLTTEIKLLIRNLKDLLLESNEISAAGRSCLLSESTAAKTTAWNMRIIITINHKSALG